MPNKRLGEIDHGGRIGGIGRRGRGANPRADPEDVFLRLAGLPHCIFFDSARRDPVLGRYSFIAADPFDYFELPATDRRILVGGESADDGLAALHRRLAPFRAETIADLPPFQGGAAGLLSYDLARQLESLPRPRFDEFGVPALAIGLYDVVVAFDHKLNRAWIISQGFPELEPRLAPSPRYGSVGTISPPVTGSPVPADRHPMQTKSERRLIARRTCRRSVAIAQFWNQPERRTAQQLFPSGISGDDSARHRIHSRRRYFSSQSRPAAVVSGGRRFGRSLPAAPAAESGHVRRLFRSGRLSDSQRFAGTVPASRRAASRSSTDQGHAPHGPPGRRPICSPAMNSGKAKRTTRKT